MPEIPPGFSLEESDEGLILRNKRDEGAVTQIEMSERLCLPIAETSMGCKLQSGEHASNFATAVHALLPKVANRREIRSSIVMPEGGVVS